MYNKKKQQGWEKVIKYLHDCFRMISEVKYGTKYGKGLRTQGLLSKCFKDYQ